MKRARIIAAFIVALAFCFIAPNWLDATDLVVTAASVARTSGSVNKDFNAGATITAGQVVYLDSNNVWQKAQNDTVTHAGGTSGVFGFALHGSLSGQPLSVQTSGIINPGATVTVGMIYCVSSNAGGIAPYSTDITAASGAKITILGIGASSTTIDMSIAKYTGYAIP